MYKGGLDIIPWPMFNDAAWFETLSSINKKLDKQEAKYENARTFLQNMKVIMAKLKVICINIMLQYNENSFIFGKRINFLYFNLDLRLGFISHTNSCCIFKKMASNCRFLRFGTKRFCY